MITYAEEITRAADHLADAIECLRQAQHDGETALHRVAVVPLVKRLAELKSDAYELACAVSEPGVEP
jgi:hypothetical protein